ncbi:MAG: endonuclease/exonuclease/phosphatase family protein [Ruminococcus sp.]|nr:endonuclease/exonuclease/phosphatase family protein [Candidatus Copronaster equi]
MKKTKKLLSVILAAILLLAMVIPSFAQEETKKEFSMITANVSGLPIPSAFSDAGRKVPKAQKELGKLFNESGIDFICTQEDFQFHSILAKEMTNYPYCTYTDGGIPVGSGVNIFSKYPIYNVERYSWKNFNGILDAANDGLTPKGLVKCTADVDGVLVDIYSLHIDANGSLEDCKAKELQFYELLKFANEHSKDRPIVMTGDWNVTLHSDIEAHFYPIMIEGAGYRDAWSEYCNDGVYFTDRLPQETINEYDSKFGGYYWGHWDSVERMIYLNGDGAELNVTDFYYEDYNQLAGYKTQALSDHSMGVCKFSIDTENYVRPDIELKTESKPSVFYRFIHAIAMYARSIDLIFKDLINMLSK